MTVNDNTNHYSSEIISCHIQSKCKRSGDTLLFIRRIQNRYMEVLVTDRDSLSILDDHLWIDMLFYVFGE